MPSSTPSSLGWRHSTAPVAAYSEFANSLTLPGFLTRAAGFQAFAEQAGIDLEYRLGEYLGIANQRR
jgi:hypothetical protein